MRFVAPMVLWTACVVHCGEADARGGGRQAVEVLQSGHQHIVSKHVALAAENAQMSSLLDDRGARADFHQGEELGSMARSEASAETEAGTDAFEASFAGGRGDMSAFEVMGGLDEEAAEGLQKALAGITGASSTGCDLDITDDLPKRDQASVKHLADFRGCYPYLADACPSLEKLSRQLSKMAENKVGNSGSKIMLAPGYEHEFVVKSVYEKEVLPIRSVLLKLYAETTAELRVRKYRTFLTPVCFMATLQYKPTKTWYGGTSTPAPETWMVMRRVRFTQDEMLKYSIGGKAKTFDLKGPGHWDAKSWIKGSDKVKDAGYKERFPWGLEVVQTPGACDPCVVIDEVLNQDSALLESMQITDYSILIAIYDGGNAKIDNECGFKHRFPAMFRARDPQSKKLFVITVGIFDVGETDVANAAMIFSTRLHPGTYRKLFTSMWGKDPQQAYFTCHDR